MDMEALGSLIYFDRASFGTQTDNFFRDSRKNFLEAERLTGKLNEPEVRIFFERVFDDPKIQDRFTQLGGIKVKKVELEAEELKIEVESRGKRIGQFRFPIHDSLELAIKNDVEKGGLVLETLGSGRKSKLKAAFDGEGGDKFDINGVISSVVEAKVSRNAKTEASVMNGQFQLSISNPNYIEIKDTKKYRKIAQPANQTEKPSTHQRKPPEVGAQAQKEQKFTERKEKPIQAQVSENKFRKVDEPKEIENYRKFRDNLENALLELKDGKERLAEYQSLGREMKVGASSSGEELAKVYIARKRKLLGMALGEYWLAFNSLPKNILEKIYSNEEINSKIQKSAKSSFTDQDFDEDGVLTTLGELDPFLPKRSFTSYSAGGSEEMPPNTKDSKDKEKYAAASKEYLNDFLEKWKGKYFNGFKEDLSQRDKFMPIYRFFGDGDDEEYAIFDIDKIKDGTVGDEKYLITVFYFKNGRLTPPRTVEVGSIHSAQNEIIKVIADKTKKRKQYKKIQPSPEFLDALARATIQAG